MIFFYSLLVLLTTEIAICTKKCGSWGVVAALRCNQTLQGLELIQNGELLTIAEVRKKFMDLMGLQAGFRTLKQSRAHLLQYLPASQDELPTRTIKETFQSAIIPLSTNVRLQEKYVSVLGHVRAGRLMEDMDIFAAWVAMNYIKNPKQPPDVPTPYVIVTVLVDQISFTDFVPKAQADIRLSGIVSSVGRSSIETTVWLEQQQHGQWQKITSAIFLMAARNANISGSAPVNKLVAADDEEKLILAEAEVRKKRRHFEDSGSVLNKVPAPDEQHVIHNLFVNSVDMHNPTINRRVLPPGTVWMADTKRSNIIFSHPEDRNLHNKVFGGFLMRQALELAWIVGYFHSKHRPKLLHISDISFKKPVDVGSLLGMTGQVIYTEENYMQIIVHAEVTSPFSGQQVTTNVFHYTYEAPDYATKVMPNTYHEAMMYIDGRRHFQEVMGLKSSS
ncbi:acyl-coenzyme A thioesterase 9, mitochondrial-like isoform X2 [Homalodisca vitripennis]|uniref:acyl-coenzyme A thioesterase 9, mitochondrial-like isoform X2 n=1 Tax=Homalodisca vitripennis TaxID=197043 RepID=UPI001EEC5D69|nr:acyl-coenzyme A thioesterase 9, mitochondrial-like isoform X2 [Homalodisca vitripennis]